MADSGPQPIEAADGLARHLNALVSELEQGILDGTVFAEVNDIEVQQLLAAATKLYVGSLELRDHFPPFPTAGRLTVTATEVAATASEMLRALQIEVFELGMWQTRGGL